MGRLRNLARRVKNAVRDRVRDGGMPSSPPDVSTKPPAPPEPEPEPAAKAEPAQDDSTDKPWYLEGTDETWGWENTNAQDDAE